MASLADIGFVYQSKGDIDAALGYYQKSMEICEKLEDPLNVAEILFKLIDLMLLENKERTKEYLRKLQKLSKENDYRVISLKSQLAEAKILKSSNRSRSIGRAHEILETILHDEQVDFDTFKEATLLLCGILLTEYKNFEQEESLEEALILLDQLYEKSQDQHVYPLMIESQILKARVEIIHGEFEKASNILDEVKIMAKEKGITGMIPKIREEQKRMSDNTASWKRMLEKTASARERMEQTEMELYLEKSIKLAKSMDQ